MKLSDLDAVIEALGAFDSGTSETLRIAAANLEAAYDSYHADVQIIADMVDELEPALARLREWRANAVEVRVEAIDRACSCAKAMSWETHTECGHVYKLGDLALLITTPREKTP
jgi:hypothetical protein